MNVVPSRIPLWARVFAVHSPELREMQVKDDHLNRRMSVAIRTGQNETAKRSD
jgi:hypothetical protein